MLRVQTITSVSSQLGESPFWHNDAIYWCDIIGQKIYRYFPKEEKVEERKLPSYVGAFAPRKKGGFILAMQDGFFILDEFSGTPVKIVDPEADKTSNRFNDGKCDSVGRFWAGTMDVDAVRGKGALYMLDKDHQVRKKHYPVTISNGMCWSSDNRYMYYIDTPAHKVVAFEFELETGAIQNPRCIITIDPKHGSPDGMTIDADGSLWIALWGGSSVCCFDPKTGKLLHKIDMPVSQVSSCAFGGRNFDELYITSARIGLNAKQLTNKPLAGRLFNINVSARGLPTATFSG